MGFEGADGAEHTPPAPGGEGNGAGPAVEIRGGQSLKGPGVHEDAAEIPRGEGQGQGGAGHAGANDHDIRDDLGVRRGVAGAGGHSVSSSPLGRPIIWKPAST